MANNKSSVDDLLKNQHRLIWNKFQSKINLKWLKSYSVVSGIKSQYYIPENIYYNFIERTLNNYGLSEAYADKNFYESYYNYKKNLFPKTYLRIINNMLYDRDYHPVNSITTLKNIFSEISGCIVKPALDSGGGYNVNLIEKPESELEGLSSVKNFIDQYSVKYGMNVVFQEYLDQHPFFAHFNTTSLNTIRVFTYRSVKDESIKILHILIRIGLPGSLVDNQASGGFSCGINKDGNLNKFAIDKFGNVKTVLGAVNLESSPHIPWIKQISEIAVEIAKKNLHTRLLGLDFCVDNNENIRLLEINNRNHEINFYQMNNGPLFGDFTEEIIEFCNNNRRSVCIDFLV